MTLEEALAKIAEMEKSIKEMEQAHKEDLHKVNTEAKGLRDKLKKVSPIATLLHEKALIALGKDSLDESDIDSIIEANNKTLTQAQQIEIVKKNAENEKRRAEEAKAQLDTERRTYRESGRDSIISGALSSVVRPDAVESAKRFIQQDASFDDVSGEWKFNGQNISGYMEQFKKSHPYFLANPIKPGSGDSSSSNGGADDFISEEDYMAMSDEQQRDPVVRDKVHKSMVRWKK